MRYWQLNRYVFSCFLNTLSEMSGERSSAGKLFQTVVYAKALKQHKLKKC